MKAFLQLRPIFLCGLLLGALVSPLKAFEDKPALTGKERVLPIALKSVGTLIGALCGVPWIDQSSRSRGDSEKLLLAGVLLGGVASYCGYKSMNALAQRILAWRHGVSYAIENVSISYDINIEQYWSVLQAAAQKDSGALRQAIEELYERRFGADWYSKLKGFFINYSDFGTYLANLKKSRLSKKEYDLMRMIELGAVLEKLYFNTKLSGRDIVQHAFKLYSFLGFDMSSSAKETMEGA